MTVQCTNRGINRLVIQEIVRLVLLCLNGIELEVMVDFRSYRAPPRIEAARVLFPQIWIANIDRHIDHLSHPSAHVVHRLPAISHVTKGRNITRVK